MNWIIGDIHGMLEKFEGLIEDIDKVDTTPTIWCVGDYCDRGPDTKGVIDLILRSTNIKKIRGNHDEMLLYILTGEETGNHEFGSRIGALREFMKFGMIQTLTSYGMTEEETRECSRSITGTESLRERIPAEHIQFLRELPILLESDDFFICHGAIPTDCPLEQVNDVMVYRRAALWGRFGTDMIRSEKEWPKHGYFGHTPTYNYGIDGPIFGPKITLIDTGAVYKRQLTTICHETRQVLSR